jgi:GNAT superfamily N-acetyltransferase
MRPDDTMEIRDARADDAPALAALFTELGFPASRAAIAKRLDALLRAGETVLVAMREGETVGVLTVHVTPVLHRPTPVGRLTALVVTETARGRGVGRALVQAAERTLAARGCALIEVTSNRRLTEAHRFYEHLGYEATSVRFKKALRSP